MTIRDTMQRKFTAITFAIAVALAGGAFALVIFFAIGGEL